MIDDTAINQRRIKCECKCQWRELISNSIGTNQPFSIQQKKNENLRIIQSEIKMNINYLNWLVCVGSKSTWKEIKVKEE